MPRALDVPSVIAGEAVSGTTEQRWNDMVNIASVIANRAAQLGITPQQVIANTNEFNAYNRAMPAGTPSLVDMANEAMQYVEQNGPVNNATFYATPAAADNLPNGLSYETETTGHQYFSDPQSRAIGSSLGYITPNQYHWAANLQAVPTPSTAPVDATAQGILGMAPPLEASAKDVPSLSSLVSVEDRFGPKPEAGILSSADISRALNIPQGMDPSFTANLMGPNNPVVPESVQTTSYTPSPQVAKTGIYSPEMDEMRANVQRQLADPSLTASMPNAVYAGMPTTSVGVGLLSPQETVSSISSPLSAYTATPTVTPAETAISSVSPLSSIGPISAMPSMSPAQIAGYQQAANSMAKAGMLNIGQQPPTTLSGELPTNFDVLGSSLPALETATIADQPTVAGPADEEIAPAQEQQQQAQTRQAVTAAATEEAAKQTLGDRLKASINPGSAIGGILGGAALGPVGGILGGLLGNSLYQNGGILGGQPDTRPGGFVGYGPQSVYGVYNGGVAPGGYAYASDGSRVEARANGDVSRTNTFGVTDTANSYGGYAGDWSGLF